MSGVEDLDRAWQTLSGRTDASLAQRTAAAQTLRRQVQRCIAAHHAPTTSAASLNKSVKPASPVASSSATVSAAVVGWQVPDDTLPVLFELTRVCNQREAAETLEAGNDYQMALVKLIGVLCQYWQQTHQTLPSPLADDLLIHLRALAHQHAKSTTQTNFTTKMQCVAWETIGRLTDGMEEATLKAILQDQVELLSERLFARNPSAHLYAVGTPLVAGLSTSSMSMAEPPAMSTASTSLRPRDELLVTHLGVLSRLASKASKGMYPYWHLFLPDSQHETVSAQPRKQSLATLLLFHAESAVRNAAAEAIEALLKDSADFLSVAIISSKTGSFTTLSQRVGQFVLELHRCLIESLERESNSTVLQQVLQTTTVLATQCLYSRAKVPLLGALATIALEKLSHAELEEKAELLLVVLIRKAVLASAVIDRVFDHLFRKIEQPPSLVAQTEAIKLLYMIVNDRPKLSLKRLTHFLHLSTILLATPSQEIRHPLLVSLIQIIEKLLLANPEDQLRVIQVLQLKEVLRHLFRATQPRPRQAALELIATFKHATFEDESVRAIAEPMAFSFASKEGADVAVHAVHGLGCMIMEHCFDAPSSMLSLFFLITTVDTAKQAAFRGRAMWALANLVDCAYKTQASWAPLSLASEMWARLRETLILALRLAPAYEALGPSCARILGASGPSLHVLFHQHEKVTTIVDTISEALRSLLKSASPKTKWNSAHASAEYLRLTLQLDRSTCWGTLQTNLIRLLAPLVTIDDAIEKSWKVRIQACSALLQYARDLAAVADWTDLDRTNVQILQRVPTTSILESLSDHTPGRTVSAFAEYRYEETFKNDVLALDMTIKAWHL